MGSYFNSLSPLNRTKKAQQSPNNRETNKISLTRMKINKTTLTKKEPLPRNFKLTFTNDKGELYLILHQNKEDIFNNLKIGADYSFSFFKGRKNYFFVNPQSIKLIMPD